MQLYDSVGRFARNAPYIIIIRNKVTFDYVKSLARFVQVRISDWKTLRIPPTLYQVPLKYLYPFVTS